MRVGVSLKSVEAAQRNIFSYSMMKSLQLNMLKATLKDYHEMKRSLLEELVRDSQTSSAGTTMTTSKMLDEVHRAFVANGYMIYDVTAKTVTRLVVHAESLFGGFAFEVGCAFHPIFNVPYIPGSSIRGAIRAYVEVNNLVRDPAEIFGEAGEQIGKLMVTDAFPVKSGGLLLEPEVTTPIYKHSAKECAASPTPIIYPVIARNVTFRFIVAMRDLSEEQERAVKNWITEALMEGLGGKTMLGYGRMEKEGTRP